MIDPALLQILCCPENHQTLSVATPELVQEINRKIKAGELRNQAGQIIQESLMGGLIRADGQRLYPVRMNIPILLIAESIPLKNS